MRKNKPVKSVIYVMMAAVMILVFQGTGAVWGKVEKTSEEKPKTEKNGHKTFVNPIDTETVRIDKIAAVVGEEFITLMDIDRAIRIFSMQKKADESENAFYVRVLDELINYKTVFLEYRNDFTLEDDDYNLVQTDVIERLGSLERLNEILRYFGMDWTDFKGFIKEKVAYEKVVNKLLKVRVSIKFNEIEDFYDNEYLPTQKKLGLNPQSLIDMSPQIENHLRKERLQKELSGWLTEIRASFKIENKLSKE